MVGDRSDLMMVRMSVRLQGVRYAAAVSLEQEKVLPSPTFLLLE